MEGTCDHTSTCTIWKNLPMEQVGASNFDTLSNCNGEVCWPRIHKGTVKMAVKIDLQAELLLVFPF